MEPTEWVVVIVCGLLGYAIVSWLIGKYPLKNPDTTRSDSSPNDAQSNSGDRFYSGNASSQKTSESKRWYETLEVSEAASLSEVQKAFRMKIQQYHPDRLEGMAPELYELALKKSQEINAAYAEAVRLKS